VIANEVLESARKTGSRVSESPADSQEILARLAWRFSRGQAGVPLWETLSESVGVHDPEAWRWPARFAASQSSLLAFNPDQEEKAFAFADGAELETVLGECSGFEFYVTNSSFDYVLCFNHHDVLVAAGTALEWLRARGGQRGT
jgi:hypothetical protein